MKNTPIISATDKAYLAIRNLIIEGKIQTFIDEDAIAKQLKISRTPMREAYLRLEADKLIDIIHRKGPLVRQITTKELIDVYETRKLIEIHAANVICKEKIGKAPQRMRICLDEMRDCQDDPCRLIELDIEFHRTLVEATENQVLLEIYDCMEARKRRVAYLVTKIKPNRQNIIFEEHEAIMDALDNKDTARVTGVLEQHLKPVLEILAMLPQR